MPSVSGTSFGKEVRVGKRRELLHKHVERVPELLGEVALSCLRARRSENTANLFLQVEKITVLEKDGAFAAVAYIACDGRHPEVKGFRNANSETIGVGRTNHDVSMSK
ncbi:hypothetical protein D3C87_1446840 [compost metagenome]